MSGHQANDVHDLPHSKLESQTASVLDRVHAAFGSTFYRVPQHIPHVQTERARSNHYESSCAHCHCRDRRFLREKPREPLRKKACRRRAPPVLQARQGRRLGPTLDQRGPNLKVLQGHLQAPPGFLRLFLLLLRPFHCGGPDFLCRLIIYLTIYSL